MEFYTIGHSNVPSDVFLHALRLNRIDVLADVRSFPASRHCPQFNGHDLAKTLAESGIRYIWLKSLGGRRGKSTEHSVHDAIRNSSFKNYADYMMSDAFKSGIRELLSLHGRVAYMCSEAVYWRCHRRMISDFLSLHGHGVKHIHVVNGTLSLHVLMQPCYRDGVNVIYSAHRPQHPRPL
jgi:uncharacterized protein (DUF488 family)